MIWITSTEINRSGRIVNDSVGHEESNFIICWDGVGELFPVYGEKVW